MTPAARRKAFQAALRAAANGTGWRHKQGVLVRTSGDFVIAVDLLRSRRNGVRTSTLRVMGKPLALDPILWAAMGIKGNDAKPVTFRYWGAFTCGWPILQSTPMPSDMDLEEEAAWIVAEAGRRLPDATAQLASTRFSDLARAAYDGKKPVGIAETLVAALVAEGDLEAAREAANDVLANGRSSMRNLNHASFGDKAGKTAIDLILETAGAQ